ncbi:acyltransferase family protein [Shinella zoogloeoides]
MNKTSLDRRRDIDGLRALAVLLVALYHARLHDIRGGFIGVDVFFVISGYLIIPMIVSAQAAERFGYFGFMLRRLRRLVPAMIPPLIFALAIAVLILGDERLVETLKNFLGAALFVSNQVFLVQSGYFQTAADERLLLHTWSLGVEFQFYAIVPFLLALCRGRRLSATIVLAISSILSFVLSQYFVVTDREAAFYLMAPRFWEFAAGGLAALWIPPLSSKALISILLRGGGLSLIVWCALTYKSDMMFPGIGALLPVVGSMLVLAAPSSQRDPLLKILTSRIANWIGLRSYSIYLWHWPLIVGATIYFDRSNEAVLLTMVALSFVAAAFSYRWVERPTQERPFWRAAAPMLAVSALLPVVGILSLVSFGEQASRLRENLPFAEMRSMYNAITTEKAAYFKTVYDSDDSQARGYQCSQDPLQKENPQAAARLAVKCIVDAPFSAPVLVIGDSHGRDVFQALRVAFPDIPFILYHQSNCAPAHYAPTSDSDCFSPMDAVLAAARDKGVSAVVLASSWPGRGQSHLDETAATLKRLGFPVAVIGATPVSKVDMPRLLSKGQEQREENGALYIRYKSANSRSDPGAKESWLQAWASGNGWTFVPKLRSFCDTDWCHIADRDEKLHLLFWDEQHLTIRGISHLAKYFSSEPSLTTFLKAARAGGHENGAAS